VAAHRHPKRVTLHRFFLPPESITEDRVTFPTDLSRQIQLVLRLVTGDRVLVLDGTGMEMLVQLDEVRGSAAGSIVERRRNRAEPSTSVALYQGLLKAAKLELVLQKCTEVGVSEITPVSTARAVVTDLNLSRLRRFENIVREAAEQSRRGRLPRIGQPLRYREALYQAAARGPVIILWEEETSAHLRDIQLEPDAGTYSLFVGPEGGFTTEEAMLARQAGCQLATLGQRILRAETAAIVGAAILLERLGQFG
jgi:16S rRNA (uracil1498-N3)-methyltransferase